MHWLGRLGHVARSALGSGAIFGALAFGAAPSRDLLRGEVAAQVDLHLRPTLLLRDRDFVWGRERYRACLRRARSDAMQASPARGKVR